MLDDKVWYRFFDSDDDAKTAFVASFKAPAGIMSFDTIRRNFDVQITCFGSYYDTHNDYGKGENADFYFALGARSSTIGIAVKEFNETFQNIQFEIVDIAEYIKVRDVWGNNNYTISENIEPEKIDWRIYLLKIHFNSGYNPLVKYVLRIPLGFFIRMFSHYFGYTSMLDGKSNSSYGSTCIEQALTYNNRNAPDSSGSLLGNIAVTEEMFKSFDDIELMNRLFSKPLYNLEFYYSYTTGTLAYGNSVLPYCVYNIISRSMKKENKHV